MLPLFVYVFGGAINSGTESYVDYLAEERKRLGLTQKQVAESMGVTAGRVSQIENGDLDVNEVATLSRYAQALGARLAQPGQVTPATKR